MDKAELTLYIKSEAERLGFDICGAAKAEAVTWEEYRATHPVNNETNPFERK